MNTLNKLNILGAVFVLSITSVFAEDIGPTSYSGFIQDNYIGKGAVVDSIGGVDYNVHSLAFTKTENILVVKIYTRYIAVNNFRYGDLFISGNHIPMTLDESRNDISNQWDYAFHINENMGSGSSGDLYTYTATDVNAPDDGLYAFNRKGQIYAINKNTATKVANNGGLWQKYSAYLEYTFDLSNTTLLNASALSFRWSLSCGNDIIQGGYDNGGGGGLGLVSEPITLGLFGLCLFCFGLMRQRRAV